MSKKTSLHPLPFFSNDNTVNSPIISIIAEETALMRKKLQIPDNYLAYLPSLKPVFRAQILWGKVGDEVLKIFGFPLYWMYLTSSYVSKKNEPYSEEQSQATSSLFLAFIVSLLFLVFSHVISQRENQMRRLQRLRFDQNRLRRFPQTEYNLFTTADQIEYVGVSRSLELVIALAKHLTEKQELFSYTLLKVNLQNDHNAILLVSEDISEKISAKSVPLAHHQSSTLVEILNGVQEIMTLAPDQMILVDPWYKKVWDVKNLIGHLDHTLTHKYPFLFRAKYRGSVDFIYPSEKMKVAEENFNLDPVINKN